MELLLKLLHARRLQSSIRVDVGLDQNNYLCSAFLLQLFFGFSLWDVAYLKREKKLSLEYTFLLKEISRVFFAFINWKSWSDLIFLCPFPKGQRGHCFLSNTRVEMRFTRCFSGLCVFTFEGVREINILIRHVPLSRATIAHHSPKSIHWSC